MGINIKHGNGYKFLMSQSSWQFFNSIFGKPCKTYYSQNGCFDYINNLINA